MERQLNSGQAKFTPVHTKGDDIISLLRRYSQVPGTKPWEWGILVDDVDALVLAQGIEVSTTGRLDAKSRQLVKRLEPRKLLVFSWACDMHSSQGDVSHSGHLD